MSLSPQKLFIIAAVGAALCLAAVAAIGFFVFSGWSVGRWLTGFTTEQTPSAHPGYRRTILSSGNDNYVQDYEEYALRLMNPEPTAVVGRYGAGKVCAVPGQKPADYVAVDVGSEMPAYEVFRSNRLPPFDWRHARFQSMELDVPSGPAPRRKRTSDPALIAEVIRTLNAGAPALPQPPPGGMGEVFALSLSSDQLPGLTFSPKGYLAGGGVVYLAENVVHGTAPGKGVRFEGRWMAASPELTRWLERP